MHARHDRDRAGLFALVIPRHDDAAVLAGRHHHGRHVRPLALNAVGAVVDPARVRVFHHHHAGGADEGAAVVLVPDRGRNPADVDRLARADVFQERPAIDLPGLMRRGVLHVAAPPADQIHLGALGRQAERDVDARHRGEDVGEHPVALGEARHLVEHYRRVSHLALIDIEDAADLLGRLGAPDDFQLAGGRDLGDPVAQVFVGHDQYS